MLYYEGGINKASITTNSDTEMLLKVVIITSKRVMLKKKHIRLGALVSEGNQNKILDK